MMQLKDLGFDEWFEEAMGRMEDRDLQAARVSRVDRERYLVRTGSGEIPAELAGRLVFSAESGEELPCVGDWVAIRCFNEGESAIIHALLPRKSFLRRKAAGARVESQMIAANLDAAFIMQSCDANFNIRRMERYLVMANEGGIRPVVLLSKSDLVDADGLEQMVGEIRRAGIDAEIISFSSLTSSGMDTLMRAMETGRTYCLLGSSGVGKTTLLNHLLGMEAFDTAPVREKDGRGRHTTSRRQLVVHANGALLIDTPGMREVGILAAEEVIAETFSGIRELAGECRFGDCTHTVEEGCAVLAAVREGALDEERYESYLKLLRESAFHRMSYAERRAKDKQFGRMIHTAMKEIKKRKGK